MGVIDTLSAGFSLINRRLWLIAIPVIIDIFLWLGPSLNMAPVASRMYDAWYQAMNSLAPQGAENQLSADELEQLRGQFKQFTDEIGKLNLLTLLGQRTPSLMAGGGERTSPFGTGAALSMVVMVLAPSTGVLSASSPVPPAFDPVAALSISRLSLLVAVWLALMLAAPLPASLFMTGMGTFVRGDRFQFKEYLRKSLLNWGRLILFYLLVLAAAIVLGLPVAIFGLILGELAPALGSLAIGLLYAATLWAGFYLFYSFAAIFVGDVNPWRALWHSFNVVRYNMGPAIGLALLIVVIGEGTALAWRLTFGQPFLVSAAIIGNAYIGAGLTCASMIFYRERYVTWQKKLRAGQQVVEMDNQR